MKNKRNQVLNLNPLMPRGYLPTEKRVKTAIPQVKRENILRILTLKIAF